MGSTGRIALLTTAVLWARRHLQHDQDQKGLDVGGRRRGDLWADTALLHRIRHSAEAASSARARRREEDVSETGSPGGGMRAAGRLRVVGSAPREGAAVHDVRDP